MSLAQHTYHSISNGHHWRIELKQCRPPDSVDGSRNPVLMIPGYGMNSFIFGYHPHGLSFEEYLTQRGFEVWSLNLRGQIGSRWEGGPRQYGLWEWAIEDVKAAVDFILKKSESQTGIVDLIGCSLGGTLSYLYTAFVKNNRVGSIVAMGSPLRWEEAHSLVKAAFFWPALVGMIPIAGTKEIIRLLFPWLMKSRLLEIYLHPDMVDLRRKDLLLETVEDPCRFINGEIAAWVKKKDLILRGKNLTHEFKKVKNPLLCIIANADGIVPPITALSAQEVSGSDIKSTIVVGTDKLRFAHADLFVSRHSHERVFEPVSQWLIKRKSNVRLVSHQRS